MIRESNKKPFGGYNTGADMWRDTVSKYGIEEAATICGNYLDMNLKCKQSEDEKNFTRELLCAMYEATANTADPLKTMYPYTFEEAEKRQESSYYHMNRDMNQACGQAISKAVNDSCYEVNFYNLEHAAWIVLLKYGFNRVSAVLAHQIQKHNYDGRYSRVNKQWAQNFIIPYKAFDSSLVNAHACLIDGFTDYVRKLYTDMGAGQYALPGHAEYGEAVHGYELTRAVMVDDDTGYALAHNPDAVAPYVCWQFKVRDGERHYNWGVYGSRQTAIDSFNARVFIHADAEFDNDNEGGK